MKNYIIGGIAALALILSIVGLVGGHQSVSTLGGTTNYDTLAVTGFQLGTSGSSLTQILSGIATSCVSSANPTINAQTTSTVDCPITGVVAGDKVYVTLASSSNSALLAQTAFASSTAGFITLKILNTATTTTTIVGATSSISYLIVR